jgi:hypothetical protein
VSIPATAIRLSIEGKVPVPQKEYTTLVRRTKMANYLLLLYDDPTRWNTLGPEEMQSVIAKYMAWADGMRGKGYVGNKLADDPGKVLRSSSGRPRVTDGPYSETKEVLGGYFQIEAASYDDAVKQAMTCPHIEYGGTIEVRLIENLRDR